MKEKGFAPVIILSIVGLMIISGVVGYSVGQRSLTKPISITNENNVKEADQAKLADYESKLSNLTKFENVISYNPYGSQILFKCYKADKLPNDSRITLIKKRLENSKTLENADRLIDTLCSDEKGNNYILNTYLPSGKYDKISQRVDFDQFTEPDFFTNEFIYQPEVSSTLIRYFKLDRWYNSGDIIFSLIQEPNGGPMAGNAESGLVLTYVKFNNDIAPKLIEFCNWGVSGGTSERYISSCKTFTTNKTSLYIQAKDL